MRALTLALAVFAAAVSPVLAASNADIARTVRRSGLMGVWAAHCDRAMGPDNPWIYVTIGKDGVVTTAERIGLSASVYRLTDARILRNGDLAIKAVWAGDGLSHDIVYRFRDGRQAIWFSTKEDGRKLVSDGVILGNGRPARWWERCSK